MVDERVRILIVDDDKLIVTMLRDIFAGPFVVLTAASGDEAVELLEENDDITAVLSDQMMPGLSGIEVLQRCMDLRPHAVRILITASEDIKDIRDAVNLARVHRVIAKPIHAVQVEGIVRGAIRERDLEKENERLVKELTAALAEVKSREAELERELEVRTQELRDVMQQVLKER